MSPNRTILCALFLLVAIAGRPRTALAATEEAAADAGNSPHVERLRPELDRLVSVDAKIEVLATGFHWTEGPLWLESEQALLFADAPVNTVYAWREGQGVSIYLKPSGYTGDEPRGGESGANGMALDADGKLVLCQHGDRQVARMTASVAAPEPDYSVIANRYAGKRFNSPNDLTIDSSGNVYFTDPPYGLEQGVDDPARELDVYGVYRVSPGGKVSLLIDDLSRPNGVGLSPDEKTLYVSNSDPERAVWMSYRIQPDGSLADGAVFYDATALVDTRPGLPDGLEVGDDGNLFAAGPGGVLIFTPAGELLGRIATGVPTGNLALNADESVLYIAAQHGILRVKLRP